MNYIDANPKSRYEYRNILQNADFNLEKLYVTIIFLVIISNETDKLWTERIN